MAFIIGIAGGSGGGKTTFIKELRERFSESEVCVISQDEYYKPIEEQEKDEEGVENFDLPRSIDKKAFRDDILKLKSGETVIRKEYMFNNSAREPKVLTFLSAPIIVVEGLFVFHFKKINALLDLKIFVDAKDVFKVARRIRRDAVERGYDINDVIYRFENHVTPSWERFIEPYRDEADIVVNNNLREMSAGFEVVCGFISQKLSKN
jgi:uridine kinase